MVRGQVWNSDSWYCLDQFQRSSNRFQGNRRSWTIYGALSTPGYLRHFCGTFRSIRKPLHKLPPKKFFVPVQKKDWKIGPFVWNLRSCSKEKRVVTSCFKKNCFTKRNWQALQNRSFCAVLWKRASSSLFDEWIISCLLHWMYTRHAPKSLQYGSNRGQRHAPTHIDWCCFYYLVRNSLVALLEALCARSVPLFVGACMYHSMCEYMCVRVCVKECECTCVPIWFFRSILPCEGRAMARACPHCHSAPVSSYSWLNGKRKCWSVRWITITNQNTDTTTNNIYMYVHIRLFACVHACVCVYIYNVCLGVCVRYVFEYLWYTCISIRVVYLPERVRVCVYVCGVSVCIYFKMQVPFLAACSTPVWKNWDEWDFPSGRGGMGETGAHRPKSGQQQCRVQNNFSMFNAGALLIVVMDLKTRTQSLFMWSQKRKKEKALGSADCMCSGDQKVFPLKLFLKNKLIIICLLNSLIWSKYLSKSWWLWYECLMQHTTAITTTSNDLFVLFWRWQ